MGRERHLVTALNGPRTVVGKSGSAGIEVVTDETAAGDRIDDVWMRWTEERTLRERKHKYGSSASKQRVKIGEAQSGAQISREQKQMKENNVRVILTSVN